MKFLTHYLPILAAAVLVSCSSNSNQPSSEKIDQPQTELLAVSEDSTVFSFVFVGCNRVQRGDQLNDSATNASSANLAVLKKIYADIVEQEESKLFFLLGDLVYAESTTELLAKQLPAWVDLYHDTTFSSISTSGIELVAVPGNHEMLSWADHNVPNHSEWPLKGTTDIWMNNMAPFLPSDRDIIGGNDSLINRMTFSFIRENVGFIVMNTDTYNAPTAENPWGLEGIIPTDWILSKITDYQNNASVDHIFVLGHKPYYVAGQPETGHQGLPEGPTLWPAMKDAHVAAMLSAHVHDYQRMQPGDEGTYQIIAGNGGSDGQATFFGYSTINILSNGKVQLISKGFDKGNPYYVLPPNATTTVRDSTILSWEKNENPYPSSN